MFNVPKKQSWPCSIQNETNNLIYKTVIIFYYNLSQYTYTQCMWLCAFEFIRNHDNSTIVLKYDDHVFNVQNDEN